MPLTFMTARFFLFNINGDIEMFDSNLELGSSEAIDSISEPPFELQSPSPLLFQSSLFMGFLKRKLFIDHS